MQASNNHCRICGAPAVYAYYGVVSCQSCKMFFRRNADNHKVTASCNSNGQCEININTRHVCGACRLKKCTMCGMTTDKFRAPIIRRPNKSVLVSRQVQKLPSRNLLDADQSLLDTSQWTLLSNLLNTFQECEIFSISQRLCDTHHLTDYSNEKYQSLIDDFVSCTYKTTEKYLRMNHDFSKLPFDDRAIVLRNAAHKISCMSGSFVVQYHQLFDSSAFSNSLIGRYGQHTIDLQRWLTNMIGSDVVLAKLAFSLFACGEDVHSYFPSITTVFPSTNQVFEIQNTYVEIVWKYLLYRYGYDQSVKKFLKLTSWLLALIVFLIHVQTLETHLDEVNSLVERTEIELILNDID
ncbi:unnamed protein product [Adineta ricciae]|uniref:Nuclear receptor domain-containing protein n=2 Tax=Adineta ricciae TaxID=249248 RepID=A0A816DGL2_ADIRI|nr:unnamed protein product [Adineta ricciae]